MIAATSSAHSSAVGVVLGLERRLGHAVAAQVVGHEPELVGERALVLLGPAEVVLRPAVDEQDRRPVRRCPTRARAAAGRRRPAPCEPASARSRRPFCRRCHLSPPRARRRCAIVAVEEAGAHRAESLIFRRSAVPYLLPRCLGAVLAGYARDTGRHGGSRERACSSGAHASSGSSSARSTPRGPGDGCDRARRRRGGHRQDRLASELAARARDAGFEVLLGRVDRSRRHGAARTSRSSRRCARSGSRRRVDGPDGRLAAAGVRGDARAARRARGRRARAARARGSALGRYARRSISSSSSRTTSPTGGFCCSRPTGRTSLRRPSAMRRLADGVRRSGSALVLELGPLEREELTALLAAHAGRPAAGGADERDRRPLRGQSLLRRGASRRRRRRRDGELPRGLRDLLLQRVARLDRSDAEPACAWPRPPGATSATRCCAHVAALPERDVRESLRQAVEHGVLVADQTSGSFRFRHALLAEAIYATILPGEREELHARLAEELARSGAAAPAELAPHWAAAGRSARGARRVGRSGARRRRRSSAWRRLTRISSGRSRCGTPCRTRAELAGLDLAELCAWAAELASQIGAAPRAVELARRAIELVGADDPHRAALLHVRLGEYLYEIGSNDAALAALERAVELVPAEPPSRGARVRAGVARGRVDGWPGAMRSRCRSPSRRSRSPARVGARRGGGPGAHRARRRPRLPRPRRGGPRASSARPCSSPRRSAITGAWSARTSISPTR